MTNFAYTFSGDEELLKEMVYRHGAVYSTVAAHSEFMVSTEDTPVIPHIEIIQLSAIRRRNLCRLPSRGSIESRGDNCRVRL